MASNRISNNFSGNFPIHLKGKKSTNLECTCLNYILYENTFPYTFEYIKNKGQKSTNLECTCLNYILYENTR